MRQTSIPPPPTGVPPVTRNRTWACWEEPAVLPLDYKGFCWLGGGGGKELSLTGTRGKPGDTHLPEKPDIVLIFTRPSHPRHTHHTVVKPNVAHHIIYTPTTQKTRPSHPRHTHHTVDTPTHSRHAHHILDTPTTQ